MKQCSYELGSDPWCIVATDEDGAVRRYGLDAFGRTNVIQETDSSGSFTNTTTLKYDFAGHLTNILDAIGENLYFGYNDAGEMTAMADPHLGQWTYKLDSAGRLRVQTDGRGNVISNSYVNPATSFQDALGRLQCQIVFGTNYTNHTLVPAMTNVYTYDASSDSNFHVYKGLLFKVTDSEGGETNGYDTRGRLINTTRHLNINGKNYTTSYAYNDGNYVTSVAYPNAGPVITNIYFHGGSLNQVASLSGKNYYTVSSSGFDELGHVTSFTYGNKLTTTRSYFTKSRRLNSITCGTVFSRTFTYTAGEDIATLKGTGLTNITVGYDTLHRITSYTGLPKNYTYDAVGNISNNIESGAVLSYGYGIRRAQAVKTVNGAKYLYDLCGNMIVRQGGTTNEQALVYDAENRLVRVARAHSNFTLVKFGYAADGARLWKWSNPTKLQVWIGNIYEERGGKILYHIYAGGEQVCTFESNSAVSGTGNTNQVGYYYHQDNLSSSCVLSDASANQIEVNAWYPFGRVETASPQAAFKMSRQFTGQIRDDETSLYYYGGRYYDAELGRFTQPDHTIADLSNPQSYNRYSYCVNNPLRYTDPDGRAPSDWANAWSGAINRGSSYVSAGPSHWVYNGTVGTVNSVVGGLSEPLRFGSTAGALSGSGHATAGQIAVGAVQEVSRAAAIVPVGAAIGRGTGALVTSLAAGGEEEAAGQLAGLANLKYHYTSAPESEFRNGLRVETHVTDNPNLTAKQAVEQLGVKTPPNKVVPIEDKGNFVPNKPDTVQPHRNGLGGGKDFYNPQRVPSEQVKPAIPVKPEN